MPDRPQPPAGSECLDVYEEGAKVYYYRSGIEPWATIVVDNLANLQQANGALRRSEALKVAGNDMW